MQRITKLLRSQISLFKPFLSNCSLATVRKGQDALGKLMANTHKNEVTCEDFTVGALECSMIHPKDEISDAVILYLHGGGYAAGNLDYAKGFATVLAAKCGIRVMCVAYSLAPEAVFPAALQDCSDAYGYLLSNGYAPARILLCGESAGGGLCYSLCLKLAEKGWTLPAGIIAISPWTDLTMSGNSYTFNRKKDPSMTVERLKYYADCYVYGARSDGKNLYPIRNEDFVDDLVRKRDPLVSPLFGTLRKMPPSLIFSGGDEIMLSDASEMHERLLAADCKSELVVADEMWHGYLLFSLKEHERDFDRIRKFIRVNVPSQKKLRWMTLDNAAKIYPAARRRNWSNLFRLSATLKEPVDREILQSALDVTVRRFPSMAVRLRAGFFWYYLEEIPKTPTVLEEKPYPLSRMMFDDIRKCAFRVLVFDRRIAVEFFHALTDGNGGLVFLKTLIAEYLYQKEGLRIPFGNGVLDRLEEPTPQELEDSFFKYAGPIPASRADTDAYRPAWKEKREVDGFRTNTTMILDAEAVRLEAKRKGVTVTAYLVAAMMLATMRLQEREIRNPRRRKMIKILIPVNLRKIFPSESLRNFVFYVTPGVDPRLGDYSFEELCTLVHHQMGLMITPKAMAACIATNVGNEKMKLLRMAPLFLKNLVMKLVFNAVGERKSCFTFSNLGVVTMPEEFTSRVERMDFVLGVQSRAPYNTSAITYGGKLNLNFIRNVRDPILEYEIYRVLRELGLHVQAESNTRRKEK